MSDTVLNKVLWPLDLLGHSLLLAENDGGWSTVATWLGSDGGVFDKNTTNSPYVAFLDEMETDFNAGGANTYEWQTVTSDAFGRDDAHLALVRTAGTLPFRLSSASATLMTQLGANAPTDVLTASGDNIIFPNTYDGSWLLPKPYNYFDEREQPVQDVNVVVTNADEVLTATKNTKRERYFEWLAVPQYLTFSDRVHYSAVRGSLSVYEQNASFEHFWNACLRQGKTFIVYHDIPRANVSLDESAYGYYQCVLQDLEGIRSMWSMLEDRLGDFGEEVYNIMLTAKELAIVQPTP